MKLLIIAVGARMPEWVEAAWGDYAKRLPSEWFVTLKEIKPESRTSGKTPQQMMAAEAKRIETAIPDGAMRVALDEHGRDYSSQKFAEVLRTWQDNSQTVAIIIGGPDGLAPELKTSCQAMIRLSSMTMPHPLVRVVLVEQIYRAWSILVNHPYHRA